MGEEFKARQLWHMTAPERQPGQLTLAQSQTCGANDEYLIVPAGQWVCAASSMSCSVCFCQMGTKQLAMYSSTGPSTLSGGSAQVVQEARMRQLARILNRLCSFQQLGSLSRSHKLWSHS